MTILLEDFSTELCKEAENMTITHNIARNSIIFSAARIVLHEKA